MIDIANEYRIIATGAGWTNKTDRGRLRFDGPDAQAFLQALLTNDVADHRPGSGTFALYLTPQGRTIADLHVFVRPDHLLADVPAAAASSLADTFDRLIFAEDVRVTDVSQAVRQLSVLGGGAAGVLPRALGIDEAALRALPLWAQIDIAGGFVARTDDSGEGSWDVVIDAGHADAAIASLEHAGAIHATKETVEAMRIDAGRPKFGVDMTTETIPLEAGLLDRAISQTKGCYVGQEVIVRVLHRGGGRVAKRLVRLACDAAGPIPAAGAIIKDADRDVGHITSVSLSPTTGGGVALGYVHRDTAEVGRRVSLSWAGGAVDAVISGFAG